MEKNNLYTQLSALNLLHRQRLEVQDIAKNINKIRQLTASRLAATYTDYSSQPRFKAAVDFMIDDILTGDFKGRDQEMENAYPVMIKLLPPDVLLIVTAAVNLNIQTLQLENRLNISLSEAGAVNIGESDYCDAYRTADCLQFTYQQLELILYIGRELDKIVHKPFIASTLKFCRGPAKLAGLSGLQDFLERGLAAFKKMKSAEDFLSTFCKRERMVAENIVQNKPNPFDVV